MIIAVDFDGTINLNGKPNTMLINRLRIDQAKGSRIILYTSREGKSLAEAVNLCRAWGLCLNGVRGGKLRADIYIDDKAMRP